MRKRKGTGKGQKPGFPSSLEETGWRAELGRLAVRRGAHTLHCSQEPLARQARSCKSVSGSLSQTLNLHLPLPSLPPKPSPFLHLEMHAGSGVRPFWGSQGPDARGGLGSCQAHSRGRGRRVAGRCRTCFPTAGFWICHLYPTGNCRESGREAESRSHRLEPPVSFQCGNFDWPEIRGQVPVSKAMEVASGCVRAGPGRETWR